MRMSITIASAIDDPTNNELRKGGSRKLKDCTNGAETCTNTECILATQVFTKKGGQQAAEQIAKLLHC